MVGVAVGSVAPGLIGIAKALPSSSVGEEIAREIGATPFLTLSPLSVPAGQNHEAGLPQYSNPPL